MMHSAAEEAELQGSGGIWTYQFVRNVDSQMRHMMGCIFAELGARLEQMSMQDRKRAWTIGIGDMKKWTAAMIEEDIRLILRRSTHFELYFSQTFTVYIRESMSEVASHVHMDVIATPDLQFFVKAYLVAVCSTEVFQDYALFTSQTPTEMLISYRHILEETLDVCSNENVKTFEIAASPEQPDAEPVIEEKIQPLDDDSDSSKSETTIETALIHAQSRDGVVTNVDIDKS